MKLTKRETTLLTVLGIVALAAAVFYFFLMPLQNGFSEKTAQRDSLELQKVQMETLLANAQIEETYGTQKQQAEKHYDSFYAILNSYTIDHILSTLMDENNLAVTRMDITPYEQTAWAFTEGEQVEPIQTGEDLNAQSEPENILLKSTVTLEAGGSYEDTLQFLNSMNAKSFCLRVRNMTVQFSTPQNLVEYEVAIACVIDIYGIESSPKMTAQLS